MIDPEVLVLTNGLSDLDVIYRSLDGEAGNQEEEGIRAVGCVIQNRVKLKWQGETTARGVCLHRKQFSCWLPGPDRDRIMKPDYVPPLLCVNIAFKVYYNLLVDITGGADSYEVTGTGAYWTDGLQPVAIIGAHSFYTTRNLNVK